MQAIRHSMHSRHFAPQNKEDSHGKKRRFPGRYAGQHEQPYETGAENANIFYASNIMGAIYPMYVRDAQGNIMVDNRGFLRLIMESQDKIQMVAVIRFLMQIRWQVICWIK